MQRDLRINPDDFVALYKIVVLALQNHAKYTLEDWEVSFLDELQMKLARRIGKQNRQTPINWGKKWT